MAIGKISELQRDIMMTTMDNRMRKKGVYLSKSVFPPPPKTVPSGAKRPLEGKDRTGAKPAKNPRRQLGSTDEMLDSRARNPELESLAVRILKVLGTATFCRCATKNRSHDS